MSGEAGAAGPPDQEQVQAAQVAKLRKRAGICACWFFGIAGLSVVSMLMYHPGARNFFGLGVGQLESFALEAVPPGSGAGALELTLGAFAIVVTGGFVAIGCFAGAGNALGFCLGTMLYAADALLLLVFRNWLGFGFHIFVLLFLVSGLRASMQLRAMHQP